MWRRLPALSSAVSGPARRVLTGATGSSVPNSATALLMVVIEISPRVGILECSFGRGGAEVKICQPR